MRAGAAGSALQRARIAGEELDQIRLSVRAGFFAGTTEMSLHRALGDAGRLGNLGRAAHLHDRQQDAQVEAQRGSTDITLPHNVNAGAWNDTFAAGLYGP